MVVFKLRISLLLCFQICVNSFLAQNNEPKKLQSALLSNCHAGTGAFSFGAKYSGSFMLQKYPKYSVGINASYEKIFGCIRGMIPQNVGTEIMLGSLGSHLKYQINPQFVFQPEVSILLGQQETTKYITVATIQYQPGFQILTFNSYQKNTRQNVMGLHLEQHLFYYPKKAKPLIIGLSVFERFLNAQYYDEDLGVCLYFGLFF
jgi:hypothetical protein